jgi:protein-S-isoprenylcysteine O-methyltransferase Ste14
MFSFNKNFQKIAWIVCGMLLLLFIGYVYSVFFKQTTAPNISGLLIIGLLPGAVIMFLLWKLKNSKQESVVKENSHTVVESIKKVF